MSDFSLAREVEFEQLKKKALIRDSDRNSQKIGRVNYG